MSLSLMKYQITGSPRDVLIMVLRALVSVYYARGFSLQYSGIADALHDEMEAELVA